MNLSYINKIDNTLDKYLIKGDTPISIKITDNNNIYSYYVINMYHSLNKIDDIIKACNNVIKKFNVNIIVYLGYNNILAFKKNILFEDTINI